MNSIYLKGRLVLLLLFLLSFSAQAEEVVASADAYVRDHSDFKDTNFGSEDKLIVKGDASEYKREAYIKFDLSTVDFSNYNDIQLKLNVKRANTDVPLIEWIINETSNEWTEAGITWNNKPVALKEITSSKGVATGEFVTFDISDYVLAKIANRETTVSVHIASTSIASGKFDADFCSKEDTDAAKRPRLVITYQDKEDEGDEEDIFDLILGRIQKAQMSAANVSTVSNNVVKYLALLNDDGSFSDIDYKSTAQTNWGPIAHLDRIKNFVLAYTLEDSSYFEDEDIYNKIVNMLIYWQDADPRSTNWYNQQIGAPQRMGILLILMRTGKRQLSTALESAIIQRMVDIGGAPDQGGSQGTGANKVDIATHWVYRGCLTKSKSVLEKGIQQVFYPLFHTTGEGFQHDYSYLQHGQQLYIGGYGDVIAQGICNVAQYVTGTDYELSEEKSDILFNFMKKTYLSVIRGKYFLYNVAGRSLSRPNALSKSGFGSVLDLLKSVDAKGAEVYDAAKARVNGSESSSYMVEPYNAHYWRSDYTIHQRPEFTFDIRLVSTRTLRNENGNGENIKGYFLSEGATNIAVDGNEYYNIFPAWDWGRIPGTTTPALSLSAIPQPAQWGTAGTVAFAGGASDGVYGVTTYAMRNYQYAAVNTEAKKSWFLFDKEVVCLGAGIKSTATAQVNTTLDQCLLSGDVTVIKSDNTTSVGVVDGSYENNLKWVLHNKVGYYIPNGGNLKLSAATQTGTWQSINTSQSGNVVNEDVFKLWFNHGVKPTNDSYAYVVVPEVNTIDKVKAYNTDNINILSNTEAIQAVEHKELGIVSVVFFGPATFKYNDEISIQATRACAVMIRNINSNEMTVHIADPSASLTNLSLIVSSPKLGVARELVCKFETDKAYAGSTKQYVINSDTPEYVPVVDNNIYISASNDTYAYGGSKTSSYGSETMIVVKTDSEAYTRTGYLQFDLSNVDLSKAKSVELLLVAAEGDTDYLNNTMRITACDSNWTETTLNWNNKPATSGSVIASAKAVAIGNPLSLDITTYSKNAKAEGKTILAFKLDNTYTGSVAKTRISFHSKESVYEDMRPRIKVAPKDGSGISNIENSKSVAVYPNPVKQGELVNFGDNFSKVIIIDLLGKKVAETQGSTFNTSILDKGNYVLVLDDTNRAKLIVE
ncbi:chondroitin AC lyase [Dysgonomonadaceae bacterium PH5-43]|nr:chondroitin AC lyase [Dysgonomonadaceae bacterium PH5-43]